MLRKHFSYNAFFVVPFLLWVVAGGMLLSRYTNRELFFNINSRHNPTMDSVMFYATMLGEGFLITAVLLALMLARKFRTWWYFWTAAACNLIPFWVQQSLKSWYDAPRPINVFKHAQWIHRAADWPELLYRSYPSGHSEGAFCFFCFLSLCLGRKHRGWGLMFFVLALSVAYSRVYLAAHFFDDIYAGSIVGTVLCIFIYSIMNYGREVYGNRTKAPTA